MAGINSLTLVGNLVDDPDFRITASGQAVCNLRIAVTERRQDGAGKWVDGARTFISGAVWRSTAENVKASLSRGMEVFVRGKMVQREFTDKSGSKRTVQELDIQVIGPTLATQTAAVTKTGAPGSRGANAAEQVPAQDPWQAEHAAFAGAQDPFNAT